MIKIDNATLYNQDCLEFLKGVEAESISCFLIDEPYGILTGHKIEEGYNLDIALQVRNEAYRVLKKDGWFVFFSQFPNAWDFGRISFEAGFKPWQGCNEIVWCKRNMSSPFGKIARIHENIFVFQKGSPEVYENKAPFEDIVVDNAFHGIASFGTIKRRLSEMSRYYNTGKKLMYAQYDSNIYDTQYENYKSKVGEVVMKAESRLSSILSFYVDGKKNRLSKKARLNGEDKDTNGGSAHVTQKPILLLRRLIKLFTKQDDIILDCFSGSGTTAIACLQEGRQFIGCERDKTYFDNSIERLKHWREDLKRQDKWLEDRGVNDFTSDIQEKNDNQPTLFD